MMKRFALALLVLLLTVPVMAQQWQYQHIVADVTVSGTAASVFSSADINAGGGHVQATSAVCSLTGANIRITYDGTTPTTSLGIVLTPGIWSFVGNATLNALSAIRDDSTSAVLSCVVQG